MLCILVVWLGFSRRMSSIWLIWWYQLHPYFGHLLTYFWSVILVNASAPDLVNHMLFFAHLTGIYTRSTSKGCCTLLWLVCKVRWFFEALATSHVLENKRKRLAWIKLILVFSDECICVWNSINFSFQVFKGGFSFFMTLHKIGE